MSHGNSHFDYDVVVIGSGFGGSVAAMRLNEKGYRVHVYEAGRRFEDHDFATTNWNIRKYLWAPALGCFGVQRIHKLPHVMILAGAGVGGGARRGTAGGSGRGGQRVSGDAQGEGTHGASADAGENAAARHGSGHGFS